MSFWDANEKNPFGRKTTVGGSGATAWNQQQKQQGGGQPLARPGAPIPRQRLIPAPLAPARRAIAPAPQQPAVAPPPPPSATFAPLLDKVFNPQTTAPAAQPNQQPAAPGGQQVQPLMTAKAAAGGGQKGDAYSVSAPPPPPVDPMAIDPANNLAANGGHGWIWSDKQGGYVLTTSDPSSILNSQEYSGHKFQVIYGPPQPGGVRQPIGLKWENPGTPQDYVWDPRLGKWAFYIAPTETPAGLTLPDTPAPAFVEDPLTAGNVAAAEEARANLSGQGQAYWDESANAIRNAQMGGEGQAERDLLWAALNRAFANPYADGGAAFDTILRQADIDKEARQRGVRQEMSGQGISASGSAMGQLNETARQADLDKQMKLLDLLGKEAGYNLDAADVMNRGAGTASAFEENVAKFGLDKATAMEGLSQDYTAQQLDAYRAAAGQVAGETESENRFNTNTYGTETSRDVAQLVASSNWEQLKYSTLASANAAEMQRAWQEIQNDKAASEAWKMALVEGAIQAPFTLAGLYMLAGRTAPTNPDMSDTGVKGDVEGKE